MFRAVYVFLLLFVCSCNQVAAKSLILNYDGFFDRMEDLDEPEYAGVKLAFYLTNKESGHACTIESVNLKTKLKTREVYVLADGEILLPFDKQLDLDKAKVVIMHKDGQDCGLDMRLESRRLLSKRVSKEQVLKFISAFDLALKELGGMMSFLLPDVTGVQFLIEEGAQLSLQGLPTNVCHAHICTIEKKNLSSIKSDIIFNIAPQKAVPYINNGK